MNVDIKKLESALTDIPPESPALHILFSLVFCDHQTKDIDFAKFDTTDIKNAIECYHNYVSCEAYEGEGDNEGNPLHSFLKVFDVKDSILTAKTIRGEFCL